jgi:hypothetical protein
MQGQSLRKRPRNILLGEVARTAVKRTVPAAFTASETFDVGLDLGSPVTLSILPVNRNGRLSK